MIFARLEAHFRQRGRLFGESLCAHLVQSTRVIWCCHSAAAISSHPSKGSCRWRSAIEAGDKDSEERERPWCGKQSRFLAGAQ